MRHHVTTSLVALLLIALSGCAGPDPLAGLLDHQDAILGLLERHAADPPAAAKAVTDYVAAHDVELTRLAAAARALHDQLADDPRAVADLAVEHQEAIRHIGERTLALRKNTALMDEPGVRAALDRVLHPD